jgi:hypothetical protein
VIRPAAMIEQAFAQMREVSVGIGFRRYPLVHLDDVHMLPRKLIAGQAETFEASVAGTRD